MKGRNYFSRADYIKYQLPASVIKVCDKQSDAVAYLYARDNSPCAVVFYGEQSKPVCRFRHRDDAEREASIKRYFEARQQHNAAKANAADERKTAVATVNFEVGKTYYDRSSCDWDTIYSFKILARSAKQLTIEERGETYKRGVYVYNGVESCKPHGTYSMCAVITANSLKP